MKELIQLAKLLREASALFSSISKKELDTGDVTWQQVLILEQIEKGPKTMGDISKAVDLSYSTTSGLINRLEQEDLVRRFRDKSDRRIVWVSLTDRVFEQDEVELDDPHAISSLHALQDLFSQEKKLTS
ncbi:MarR family winged helix-turn-helix transcriptional regulator [Brevibacillus choshinensis]|uniref:MarR family winged helix-turn-helix transcriptional regulator n=1 Tax=Brevibacillus choshinensis TaxID=54911 RepID=UPI002E1C41C6|nr:MarR family transcriptional regulator [Brevibacillus choshinensis]MED4750340.1 MarR family transcriptional regulator [Brevibacillus choshinensis]MED4780927.1 MarR family transcriptional regulator [Brevibacillus choshinensis]